MAEATLYYRTAGGALASRVVTGEGVETPALPDGATPLTEAEHAAALADVQAQRQEYADGLVAAAEAAQQEDYQALRSLNVPEDTARRLSGYSSGQEET
ncbi:hypothetical protein ABZ379_33705 [Streptomyces canus]|uniref:hypothetical protein n=1 Tax=Streptomyces canus TaxID=58343 RepID=UPI003406BC30